MRRVVLHGCVDRKKLIEICWLYAKKLFREEFEKILNENNINKYKEFRYQILCFINVCIRDFILWARKSGEDFSDYINSNDLSIVRERYIEYLKSIKSN